MAQFFYDQQIRRFLVQFARMFSGFQVEGGIDASGNVTYVSVPIRYGDSSRQAAVILQENSRNNIPCAPLMTFYITDLKYDRDRIQAPTHVDKRYIKQRAWDTTAQTYEQVQGNAFTVERLMPVPHLLNVNLDIWTTNTNQKFQIYEQITTLFNPSLEIQSTDNYLDWTSLSVVERDGEKWSSRSVAQDNGQTIDIMTFAFKIPIWISEPARVTKEGIIHKVIASIYDTSGAYVDAIDKDNILLGTRLKITPGGYEVLLIGNELRILPYTTPADTGSILSIPNLDSTLNWGAILGEYGTSLIAGISQVRLQHDNQPDIIGTVAYDPTREDVLIFTVNIDTLPSNTLTFVNAIVDPTTSGPLSTVTGTRYLLLEDVASPTTDWGTLIAKKNDIIQYNGTNWVVSFDSTTATVVEYVTNETTLVQYKFENGEWLRSYEGIYVGGNWSVVI